MDKELRAVQRRAKALNDPEAKDRYIVMLERLVGINSDDDIKLWEAHYCPPETRDSMGYSIAISFTEKGSQREAAKMFIRMVVDELYPMGEKEFFASPNTLPVEEWDEYETNRYNKLKTLRALFEEEKYLEVCDSYTANWDSDCSIEFYHTAIT